MVALEEVGCDYDVELIAFMDGQHRAPAYLSMNPKGKVPVLVADGRPLSENVAILTWLARSYPNAGLLPFGGGEFEDAIVLSDLAYCASGLHPIVTRMRIPQFFCDIPGTEERVYALAEDAMRLNFAVVEQRLETRAWWYGNRWSVLDAYINWIWFRVAGTGFDVSKYPRLIAHNEAMFERPSVQRMLKTNADAAENLASLGLAIRFDGPDAIAAATR